MALIVLLVIYFLPSIIAKARERPNSQAIFLTNLLLGWTLVGWIAAMAWVFNGHLRGSRTDLVADSSETANYSDVGVLATKTHPLMSFRPSTREECEGFQTLSFGICCATCELSGDDCPFQRTKAAHAIEPRRASVRRSPPPAEKLVA